MLMLLRQHPSIALDFIVDVFNHVADWYAHPRIADPLESAFEVELKFPNGNTKTQWCNGRLWNLYRGTSVGPYVLQSYLMALEVGCTNSQNKNRMSWRGFYWNCSRRVTTVPLRRSWRAWRRHFLFSVENPC